MGVRVCLHFSLLRNVRYYEVLRGAEKKEKFTRIPPCNSASGLEKALFLDSANLIRSFSEHDEDFRDR